MEREGAAQLARIQSGLATDPKTPPLAAWLNGSVAGTDQPYRLFVGPHLGSGGAWTWGAVRINPDDLNLITPGFPPQVAIQGTAREGFRLLTHEYFHSLQAAWGRERWLSDAHINGFLSEGLAASVELNLCALGFPDAPANECVSPGKLGVATKGVYQSARVLDEPEINVLEQYYASAIFWRYVYEQFAYPIDPNEPVHPAGSPSGVPRASNADVVALNARPFSDEGIDFIGQMFKTFALSVTPLSSTDLVANTIEAHLGRKFESFLLDFQTAMVLKDYTEVDPRWRFEWTHQEGYAASTRISMAKPFAPSPDLYGPTCGLIPGGPVKPVCDGLTRARRLHDSWSAGASAPVAFVIPPGQGVSSVQDKGVGAFGAAYASFRPDTSSIGQKLPKRFVRATAVNTIYPPKFRVFRIKQDAATGAETPVPVCGAPPEYVCPTIAGTAKAEWEMSAPVTITKDTSEILLVVGGSRQPRQFRWSFGDVQPKLTLIEPTNSLAAFVGQSGPLRRSFIIKLTLRDSNNKPLTISKADVDVRIHGCKDGSSLCTLSPQDFAFQGYSGGNYWLTVTLPDEVYPADPQGSMGLEVTAGGASDVEDKALSFQESQRPATIVIAIDRSSVMSVGAFALARTVAKTIVQSLLPPPGAQALSRFGLVPFDQDATTLSHPALGSLFPATPDNYHYFEDAIDDMLPFDQYDFKMPSLGDALFESQSVLGGFYDSLPGAGKTADQRVMLISPGFQLAGADPITYLAGGSVPNDGQGPAWVQPSSRGDRISAGLSVPRISTIAVGAQVDLSRLDVIARETGGTLFDASGTVTPTFAKMLDGADSAMASLGEGMGFHRVSSARTRGEPVAIRVEPGATELKVTVMSALGGGALGTLVSPSGEDFDALVSTRLGNAVTYRVPDPTAGEWLLETSGPVDSIEPVVFVEASVQASLQLFAAADVMEVRPLVGGSDELGPEEQRAFVGSDVVLRATPWQHGPVRDCTVRAAVQRPGDAEPRDVALRDDGLHHDELAGDGVFGALFAATGRAGAYVVRTRATCRAPDTNALVEREKLTSVVLHALADEDESGIPDAWEEAWGIRGSADDDPDSDGLTNEAELQLGTSPIASDSDGGGESDTSERLAGRDPRDPEDDAIGTPALLAIAGNALVYLPAGLSAEGTTLEVERAPSEQGPFVPLPAARREGAVDTFDSDAQNDVRACYRMRALSATATSGWSVPSCVTPRLDPRPPRVGVRQAPTATRTRDVRLLIDFEDPTSTGDGPGEPELGVISSGVTEMRVWFGAGPPDGILWQPASSELLLRLPHQDVTFVRVQVRDLAGNVSEPAGAIITRPQSSPLERAIALEELAEDLLESGDTAGAKAAIVESIAETKAAHSAAVTLVAQGNAKSAAAVQAVVLLGKVLGLKAKAVAFLNSNKIAESLDALKQALALELQAANLLDAAGEGS